MNPEEKSEVLLTVGMVILHYQRSCQKVDAPANWCVGILSTDDDDVLQTLIDQYKITNPLISDTIGYWKVNSKIITNAALKKLKGRGFIKEKVEKSTNDPGEDTHIFIYRKHFPD